ncbi:MAG: hypothetical protein H0U69_03615 [Trueperaceae bacterium]|nr:hypothetical protein [Trueperaceae bacterium]
MPKLVDDLHYAAALTLTLKIHEEETHAFKARLADRSVALVYDAMSEMGAEFNEATVRRHLARMPDVYVEESLRYIRRVLVRVGEVELAKKLEEAERVVGLDDLPEAFRDGYDEMLRGGLLGSQEGPEPRVVTQ